MSPPPPPTSMSLCCRLSSPLPAPAHPAQCSPHWRRATVPHSRRRTAPDCRTCRSDRPHRSGGRSPGTRSTPGGRRCGAPASPSRRRVSACCRRRTCRCRTVWRMVTKRADWLIMCSLCVYCIDGYWRLYERSIFDCYLRVAWKLRVL